MPPPSSMIWPLLGTGPRVMTSGAATAGWMLTPGQPLF
jgi:hypothetical protein